LSSPEPPPPRRVARKTAVQALVSGLVLLLLLRGVDLDVLLGTLGGLAWAWVGAATALKITGLTVRELRLFVAIRPWHEPRVWHILGIGFASGLVNSVVPARGGDVLAMALLKRECRVSLTAAAAAVAVTSLLEAVVFGVLLLGLLLGFASQWGELFGIASAAEATSVLSVATVVTIFGTSLVAIVARRLRAPPAQAQRPRLSDHLRNTMIEAGRGLGARSLIANALLAVLQVAGVVGTLVCLFPALDLHVEGPFLAAALFVAASSVVAVLLPASMVAGGAAASMLVLLPFGATDAQAIAFAAMVWAVHSGPTLLLGAVPLWRRLGGLQEVTQTLEDDPATA